MDLSSFPDSGLFDMGRFGCYDFGKGLLDFEWDVSRISRLATMSSAVARQNWFLFQLISLGLVIIIITGLFGWVGFIIFFVWL